MILGTTTDAEADAVFARAKAGEFRILALSRVRGRNAAWSFSVSDPPEQREMAGVLPQPRTAHVVASAARIATR